MRKLLPPVILLAAFLGGAQAPLPENESEARARLEAVCHTDNIIPASLSGKIIMGNVAQAQSAQLRDTAIPTEEHARAIRSAYRDTACRHNTLAYLRTYHPRQATFEEQNNRILDTLIARKMSYGVANRAFLQARFDYLRLTGVILQQQTQSSPDAPVPLYQGSITPPEERARQNAEDSATVQRLMDEAERARRDAVRPALCPSNPAGIPNQPYDPAQPFC